MHLGLLALAIGGFGIGTTEFVVMGLLPDIASGLGITIPQAGHMIAAYAVGVVVGAPILTGIAGRYPPASILMVLMALFTFFNALSAFAFNYPTLLLVRFLSGLPHGAFFGVGVVVASRLAARGKEASAVATMFSGLTIANVVGVPFATYLGHQWGWRWAFVLVAVIGALTIGAVRLWVPQISARSESSILGDLKILKRPNLLITIALISLGFGGFFAWMSYLVPLYTHESGFSAEVIPFLMAVAGVGMTVGNILGGKLADRVSPLVAIIGLMLGLTVILILNGVFAESQVATAILTFVTGAFAMAVTSPIQVLLISNSQGAEMFGASLGQSSFNIGNALGAYLGGLPLVFGLSYSSPQWVGAGLSIAGAFIAMYLMSRLRREKAQAVQGSRD